MGIALTVLQCERVATLEALVGVALSTVVGARETCVIEKVPPFLTGCADVVLGKSAVGGLVALTVLFKPIAQEHGRHGVCHDSCM